MNLKSNYNAPKYGGDAIATPVPDSMQAQIKEQILAKYPSSLANAVHDETMALPYNRMVSRPEPGIILVEPITTKIIAQPKVRPFKEGDLVEVKTITDKAFVATYWKKDGQDRSFIRKASGVVSCYTYQLSHV